MCASFDLDTFLRQPRLAGLTLSPDGRRLVVGVATPAPDGSRFRTALWQVDPGGGRPPRQLTRSSPGESAATFAPDGALLFVSARPDPDASGPADDPPAALWRLPADGGEARLVVAPPAGVTGAAVAERSGDVVVHSSLHPRAGGFAEDEERHRERADAGVTAQLFEDYPIRSWDSYLGPREPGRWFLPADRIGEEPVVPSVPEPATRPATDADPGTTADPDDLADVPSVPEPALLARGSVVQGTDGHLAPDGSFYVTGWRRSGTSRHRTRPADLVADLVLIETATGERRTLVADGRWYAMPRVSPDGTRVIAVAEDVGAPDRVEEDTLVLVDLRDGSVRDVAADWDRWPANPRWLPDGTAVVVEADDHGHRPLFRIDLGDDAGDRVTRLTGDGACTDVCIAPDGHTVYALHATVGSPHRPVRFDASAPDQDPVELPAPVGVTPTSSTVERVTATADDGAEIESWLVLPSDVDGPVPLVVFIHGGPLGSWNTWHWRWSPAVFADHGYAVLLPDPALSTGYGRAFVARGWGRWGDRPATDVLAAVASVVARDDIDADRVAAAGGSFGGYLANWLAGHTDRFRCIVTHASLWALEGFHGTTDLGLIWEREFGDPYADPSRYHDNSPHRFVGDIRTPMLVIHGERDYRVPISEALTLWTDLSRHGVDARFLYFPDENHWILKPQNARVWYATFLAFVDEHLRDREFVRPDLL